jgi:hypothetical protein
MTAVGADMFAEGVSTAMLGMRLFVNTANRWDCQFFENGTLNPMDCRNRENETEWFMKNGKNIKKSVLKNIIQVGMALDKAMNGTLANGEDKVTQFRARFLDANNTDPTGNKTDNKTDPILPDIDPSQMDFGKLNETVREWM